MSVDAQHMPYARETAVCVDLALDAMEDDIRAELAKAAPSARAGLERILAKLLQRRDVLSTFTRMTTKAA